eukprot:maker-scaffold_43-snap-gene-1.26-mRNA-1 protein AED:0.17 eAED:0.17 QI:125/0.5/0.33/1/1/1/3/0/570
MKIFKQFILLVSVILVYSEAKLPNVIILFVDDMGYGDVGYSTNQTVLSPNIDSLANQGVKFSQWLSADSICTPSRGALLTGRLPIRLGLSSGVYYERVLQPMSPGGLPLSEETLAKQLKKADYETKLVGKWHLGLGGSKQHLPTRYGFDQFYGLPLTNVQSCGNKNIFAQDTLEEFIFVNTKQLWIGLFLILLTFFLSKERSLLSVVKAILVRLIGAFSFLTNTFCILYNDETLIQQPLKLHNLTQRLTINAKEFIKSSVEKENPFFLYMSYVKLHTALFNNPEFNKTSSAYQNNILELDWSVGEITSILKKLGVFEDTLIWFTSDNGPFLERGEEGGSTQFVKNGKLSKLKGGKAQIWEGGFRVPGFVSYPSYIDRKIKGSNIEQAVGTMDIYPTTLSIVEQLSQNKFDTNKQVDGKDISPLLKKDNRIVHETMFHYCGDMLSAIRIQQDSNRGLEVYKVYYHTPIWLEPENQTCMQTQSCQCTPENVVAHNPPLVFDLVEDLEEEKPLEYTNKVKEILQQVEERKEEHLKSLEQSVVSEVKRYQQPWLKFTDALCCNFPSCECDDDIY